MSGRGSAAAGAMEEGQAGYQSSSEDGSTGSNRCSDDMISVQFIQKVRPATSCS